MNILIHYLIIIIVFIIVVDVTIANIVSLSGASYNCTGQISSDESCSNAFDNNVNTFWMQNINTTSQQKQYVNITLSSPMIVTSYQVYMLTKDSNVLLGSGYDYSFQVTSWTFEGSNSGSSYTTLSTVNYYDISNVPYPASYILFNCSSPASYKYYRFNVAANWFIDNGYSTSDNFMLIELVLNVSSPSSPTPRPTQIGTTPSVQSTKSNITAAVAGGVVGALVLVAIVGLLYRSYILKQQQGQQGTGTNTGEREAAMSPMSHRISVSKEQENPMQSRA